MNTDTEKLSNKSVAYGVAVTVTALFNTALACVKDAYRPLQNLMNAITGHNWTTQGLADVVLFVVLGLILSKTQTVEGIRQDRLISFLVAAIIVAGIGLFIWYALF
jgi:hypothetical protein